MSPARGSAVHLDYRKWDGCAHWQIDTVLLGEDEWGSWLYAAAGSTMSRPGLTVLSEVDEVIVVSPQLAATPGFYAVHGSPARWRFDTYVDMTTVPVWTSDHHVTMIDLDLDVVRHRDGTVEVLDEDEFAEHSARFGYPDEVRALATQTCSRVADALRGGNEPYGDVWRQWLERGVNQVS